VCGCTGITIAGILISTFTMFADVDAVAL
jgi:hypothetical protein